MRRLITKERVPDAVLMLEAHQLIEQLEGPTLFHLPGQLPQPLFVSVLLHGNETTGWDALRTLLLRYSKKPLPRALSFLIGNVEAAAQGARHLDGQPDYNRVWAGGEGSEQQIMAEVVEQMRQRGVFASIDIHNNTGRNPHYGCVNRLEPTYLQLAALFSRTVVYFIKPSEVQSMAFSPLCPAITIECGQPGDPHGVAHVLEFLESALCLSKIPSHPVAPHEIDLFHTVATVKIPDTIEISFGDSGGDLCLIEELDQLNFREIEAGTRFGKLCSDHLKHLEVWNEAGQDVGDHFFSVEEGALRTRKAVMPSMLTRDIEVIRQDCLCYLMERMSIRAGS
ncbi:MAG: peptidase M14 [Gammaproteobacteria bacterium]|jgi:hypothetical protein|nr:peptidase M14 [Gammaproteobacteria bacterium]